MISMANYTCGGITGHASHCDRDKCDVIVHDVGFHTLLQAANSQSRQRYTQEVNTAVTFYAYGYADGRMVLTATQVERFLYDYLSTHGPKSRPVTASDVIKAAGQFIQAQPA